MAMRIKKRTFTTEKSIRMMAEIEDFIRQHGTANAAQLIWHFSVSATTINTYLNHMQDSGIVRRLPRASLSKKSQSYAPEVWELGRSPDAPSGAPLIFGKPRIVRAESQGIFNLDPLIHALFPWMRP